MGGAIQRDLCGGKIHAAFEAVGRIGIQAETARFANDDFGCKECAFKEDVGSRLVHRAVGPAHHAGQRDRALAVGDHQHVVLQINGLLVQQFQALALAGKTHVDIAVQLVQIESMQRLPQLKQHVVGHIDQRADAA